jgi:hypothetical protein
MHQLNEFLQDALGRPVVPFRAHSTCCGIVRRFTPMAQINGKQAGGWFRVPVGSTRGLKQCGIMACRYRYSTGSVAIGSLHAPH